MTLSSLYIILYTHFLTLQYKKENEKFLNQPKLKESPQHEEGELVEEPLLLEA
jgi:hypothetical protein